MSKAESDAESSALSSDDSDDDDVSMQQSSAAESSECDSASESGSDASDDASASESSDDSSSSEDEAAAAAREDKKSKRREANAKKSAAKAAANGAPAAAAPAAAGSAPAAAAWVRTGPLPSTLLNPKIAALKPDFYYHLGLSSELNLKRMFGDVRFVIMSGSAVRAQETATKLLLALNVDIPTGSKLAPIGKTERYSLYKVGPVLSISHGMGKPSASIMLHEITKLLAAAGSLDKCTYIRVGTSGGLGAEPGSVVISTGAVNGALQPNFPVIIFGKTVQRPCVIDTKLVDDIFRTSMPHSTPAGGPFKVLKGLTMATDDFYEGQGRLDGAIAEYSLEDKMAFLKVAHKAGVKNIEMESDCVVAFCTKLNIPVAVVCATIVNRLAGDQVSSTPQQLVQYTDHAVQVAIRFIQSRLHIKGKKLEHHHKHAEKVLAMRLVHGAAAGEKSVPHVAGSGTDFPSLTMDLHHSGAPNHGKPLPAANSNSNSQKKGKKGQQQQNGKQPDTPKAAAAAGSQKKKEHKGSDKKKDGKNSNKKPAAAAPTTAPSTPASSTKKQQKESNKKDKKPSSAPAAAAAAAPSADAQSAAKVLQALEKADKKKDKKAAKAAPAAAPAAPATPAAAPASDKKKKEKKSASSDKKKDSKPAVTNGATTPVKLASAPAAAAPASAASATPALNRRQKKKASEDAAAAAVAAAEQKVRDDAATVAANKAADLLKFNPDAALFPKVHRPTKNERLALAKKAAEEARNGGAAAPGAAGFSTPVKSAGANGSAATEGKKRKVDSADESAGSKSNGGAATEKKAKKSKKDESDKSKMSDK